MLLKVQSKFGTSTDSGRDLLDFDRELDQVRRFRLALVATVGAVMCVILQAVNFFFQVGADTYPKLTPGILDAGAMIFHTLTFVAAAFIFRIRSLHTQTILVLDLLLFATNILARTIATISFASTGDHFPGIEGILLALVLHGIFVPTHVSFSVILATFSVMLFPLAQVAGYHFIPSVHAHWDQVPGRDPFSTLVVLNTISIAFFGLIGILSNKIIYGLSKDAFKAKRLGNYNLEQELDAGGMGKIFVGRHRMLRRPVAIKVLNTEILGGEEAILRFEREVDLASNLTHPNTISIFDFGRASDGTFYCVMELLTGFNLQQLVKRHGPIHPARVVYLLKQVCASLAEAHALGIIHRDIKPSNIIVTQRGGLYDFIKVIDFGLAKQTQARPSLTPDLTDTGIVFGTPYYMAPEGVYGADKMDHRGDIYALGGVAYWLLTGHHVFEGEQMQVLIDQVKTLPQLPSKVSEQAIPDELEKIVMKCLEKKPDARFASVDELFRALEKLPFASSWSNDHAKRWWAIHGLPSSSQPS